MTKYNKTREWLINMYINALKENSIPWRNRWQSNEQINGITNVAYKGVNQLLLSFISSKEGYKDIRWLTYLQIKSKGYKLKNAKGKGVPVEFWSVYDIKNKCKIDLDEYQKIIDKCPELKDNYKLFCNTSHVYNAECIEGLEPINIENKSNNIKEIPKFINNVINNFKIKYEEKGNMAYYVPSLDKIFLPNKDKFIDNYSYYATLLHELCHATGHKKRLNRLNIKNKLDRAREELIAEISSSFLMAKLKVDAKAEHYDNHKAYIQSWISLLENNPSELFKAINESNKVTDYITINSKEKNRDKER